MSAFRRLADVTRSFFRADGNHATDVASLRLLLHSGTRLETLTQVGGYRRNAWVVIAEIRNCLLAGREVGLTASPYGREGIANDRGGAINPAKGRPLSAI